jgi:hypothetical protein
MSDNALDQIVDDLRTSGSKYFPQYSDVKSVRVVGHTPKPEQYSYEVVVDFAEGSERVNAKLHRGKSGSRTHQDHAKQEAQNLEFAHQSAEKRKLNGIPRPIGDYSDMGAVVSTKVNGLPLQSIIMKAALLPDGGNYHLLESSAKQAGEWLQQFHKATASMPAAIDADAIVAEFEKLCARARKEGLPEDSTNAILANAKSVLKRQKKPLRTSAVLQEFIPLNVLIAEDGIGFCEFANLDQQGHSLQDAAIFLAAVEALEKYPFCNRNMTSLVQEAFVSGYGVSPQEEALLDTFKMKMLLQMFAQGRLIKESAERKKVMWANVMKRFIQQAAERSAARVA